MAWYGWLVTVMTWSSLAVMFVAVRRSMRAWDDLMAEVVELRRRLAAAEQDLSD